MTDSCPPAAFLSYAHIDDNHGGVAALREALESELRVQTGRRDIRIFQDRDDIAWAQEWRERIDSSLDAATFLIPMLTPSFFTSHQCRLELQCFLDRERRLGRRDLILPVYWIQAAPLEDSAKLVRDPLTEILATRQHTDWRELRFRRPTDPQTRRAVAGLAAHLRNSLDTSSLYDHFAAATRTHVTQVAQRALDVVRTANPDDVCPADGMDPSPPEEREPPGELLREVFDLIDEAVGRVTDDEIDVRLHRLLGAAGHGGHTVETGFADRPDADTGDAGTAHADFFVSYSVRDARWAEWIAWTLEDAGYRVLIQACDFPAGAHFVAAMHRAAQHAARTVAVLSTAYLTSAYAEAEWQAAWHADPAGQASALLAFRVEDCPRPGLLGQLVAVDLFDLDRDTAATRLLAAARDRRGNPAPAYPGRRPAAPDDEPAFPGLPPVFTAPLRLRHFTGSLRAGAENAEG